MVQSAKHRSRVHGPGGFEFDGARLGRILREREVGATAVVVLDVLAQQGTGVALVEHDDVIEKLAPKRADDALAIGIGQSSRLHPMRVVSAFG